MIQRHILQTRSTTLANLRQVKVVCSTPTRGRDDIEIPSSAFLLERYRQNPVWLWQHDPEKPIARAAAIGIEGKNLVATVQFPPSGVSALADEVFGLIQAGVISAASTGFEVIEVEPIDPKRSDGGIRIVRCELQEMSWVSIPAVPDALIAERARRAAKPEASRSATVPSPHARRVARKMIKDAETLALAATFAAELMGGDVEGDGRLRTVKQLGRRLLAIGEDLLSMPGADRALNARARRAAGYEIDDLRQKLREPDLVQRKEGRPAYDGTRVGWLNQFYIFEEGRRR